MTADQVVLVEKLGQALEAGGGLLTVPDVLSLARERKVQLWAPRDDAIAATQILDYPRGRVVDVFAVGGTLRGVLDLEPQVADWAREQGAIALVAHGRPAWGRVVGPRGWQMHSMMFVRRLQKLNGGSA